MISPKSFQNLGTYRTRLYYSVYPTILYHKKFKKYIAYTAKLIAKTAIFCYNNAMAPQLIDNTYYGENKTAFSYVRRPAPTPTNALTHLHNAYEILFFYEGDANYHIGGNIYHLTKNDLLVIKPSVYHNISLLSSQPYSRIVLSFHEKDFPTNIVAFLQSALPYYHVPDDHPILQIMESMRSASEILPQEDFEQFFIAATTNIVLLLPHLQNETTQTNNDIRQSTFDNILSYIDKNPDKPLTLAWLSKIFFLSESRISHLFKLKLNTTTMQYINRKKISYAHSLLISGLSPIQVANKCGFKNYSTFYRLYKNFFGTTPSNPNQ